MSKYKRITLIAIFFAITAASLTLAQSDLQKKTVQQWSKSEVEKFLTNSPWAKTQEARELPSSIGARILQRRGDVQTSSEAQSNTIGSLAGLGESTSVTDYKATLLLRSALPVRMALVRRQQINSNYDKMGEEERAAFDAKMKVVLDCPECADYYILTLTSRSASAPGSDAIYQIFADQTLATLKDVIYLANERGEKRELAQFIRPLKVMEEAVFFFRRKDEKGNLLFTPADKKLLFKTKSTGDSPLMNFKLDISKLVVNNEVLF